MCLFDWGPLSGLSSNIEHPSSSLVDGEARCLRLRITRGSVNVTDRNGRSRIGDECDFTKPGVHDERVLSSTGSWEPQPNPSHSRTRPRHQERSSQCGSFFHCLTSPDTRGIERTEHVTHVAVETIRLHIDKVQRRMFTIGVKTP